MAISDKLTYLNDTKTKIRKGLNDLGAELTTEDTFRSYVDAIDEIYEDYPKITGEGESLSLDNTKQASMQIDYKGNTSQTGTPTPSSPIPVNVVSGDNTINICGKNLLDISTTEVGKAWNGNTATNRAVVYIKAKPSTTYTISYQTKNGNDSLYYFEKINKTDTTNLSGVNGVNFERTITTNASTKWLGIQINKETITYEDVAGTKLQIEKGSTATTYEPYIGNTYPLYLGDIELCKIGDYQDYIYKDNGSWYLHKEVLKVKLTSSMTWYKSGTTAVDKYYTRLNYDFDSSIVRSGSLCNRYKYANNGTNVGEFDYSQNNTVFALFFCYATYNTSTINSFKADLDTNEVICYVPMPIPTNTLIEDTTLIEQLEALKLATSYEGQTNISQDNNDLPFILDVKALRGE